MSSPAPPETVDVAEFESAVLVAMNPVPSNVQDPAAEDQFRRATEYVQSIISHPSAWKLCLHLLTSSGEWMVRFFALQGLEQCFRSEQMRLLSFPDRHFLRNEVLQWLQRSFVPRLLQEEPFPSRNRLALCLALLVKMDYPEQLWETPFSDLLGILCPGVASAVAHPRPTEWNPGGDPHVPVAPVRDVPPGLAGAQLLCQLCVELHHEVGSRGALARTAEGTVAVIPGHPGSRGDRPVQLPGAEEAAVLRQRMMQVKDGLREDGSLLRLAELWFAILKETWDWVTRAEQNGASSKTAAGLSGGDEMSEEHPQVRTANTALQCIEELTAWCDVALMAHERFLALHVAFLRVEPLRVSALACLYSLVRKGMDPSQRLELLHATKLLDTLVGLPLPAVHWNSLQSGVRCAPSEDAWMDEEELEWTADAAELVALIGVHLIEAGRDETVQRNGDALAACTNMIHTATQYTMEALPGAPPVAAKEFVPFLHSLMVVIRDTHLGMDPIPGCDVASVLPSLLRSMLIALQYPPDHDFTPGSDDAAETDRFRSELGAAIANAIQAHPDTAFHCLVEHSKPVVDELSSGAVGPAEACLRAWYYFGEAMGRDAKRPRGDIANVLVQLHRARPMDHEHPAVLATYNEMSVRFVGLFGDHSDLLQPVVEAMVGGAGLQHKHPPLRSRSAFLLRQLVATMPLSGGSSPLAPLAAHLLDALRPFLTVPYTPFNAEESWDGGGGSGTTGSTAPLSSSSSSPSSPAWGPDGLTHEDRLNLFELVGHLLAQKWVSRDTKQACLEQVLGPLLAHLDEGLRAMASRQDELSPSEMNHFGQWVAQAIGAAGCLVKGFPRADESLEPMFRQLVEAAGTSLRQLPFHDAVRDKCRLIFHHFVHSMGERIVPLLAPTLPLLFPEGQPRAMSFGLALLTQVVRQLRPDATVGFLGETLPFLVDRIHNTIPAEGLAPREDATAHEHAELLRKLFQFVVHTMSRSDEVPSIWQSGAMSEKIPTLLHMLRTGVVQGQTDDHSVRKHALAAMCALVECWWPEPHQSVATQMEMSQSGFACPLRPGVSPALARSVQAFLVEQGAGAVLEMVLLPSFSLADAQAKSALQEGVRFWTLLAKRCGGMTERVDDNAFLQHAARHLLPSVGCPPEACFGLADALRERLSDSRASFSVFVEFAANLQGVREGS